MTGFSDWEECPAGYVIRCADVETQIHGADFDRATTFAAHLARLHKAGGRIMRADNRRVLATFEYKGGPTYSVAFTRVNDVGPTPMSSHSTMSKLR